MSYNPYGVLCEDCAGWNTRKDRITEAMHAADMEREYYAWLEQQYEKDPQSQVGAGMRDIVL